MSEFAVVKDTNPKDAIAGTKLPLGLVPTTAIAFESLAFLEGMLKYGRSNWRAAGARASVYYDAAGRHMDKWWEGEDADPLTRVKHLASARACLGILIDAEYCGKLEDDRPPTVGAHELISELEATVAHLKEVFKEHDPYHYAIKDKV
jgi:hypothetical protein